MLRHFFRYVCISRIYSYFLVGVTGFVAGVWDFTDVADFPGSAGVGVTGIYIGGVDGVGLVGFGAVGIVGGNGVGLVGGSCQLCC